MLDCQTEAREKAMKNLEKANALSASDKRKYKRILAFLTSVKKEILANNLEDGEPAFAYVNQEFDSRVKAMKEGVAKTSSRVHHLFEFTNQAFAEGNEMLVLVTELTVNSYSARYISTFGCEDYHKYNQVLMVSERQEDLREEVAKLGL
jgi:hypothetical protein